MKNIYMGVLAAFISSTIVAIALNVLSAGDLNVSTLIFLYTLLVYFLLGIPLSIFIEHVRCKRRWWQSFSYYMFIGLVLSGIVLLTSSLEMREGLWVSAFIVGCVFVYVIVHHILSNVRKMGRKYKKEANDGAGIRTPRGRGTY
ncbi:hypothetical protein VKA52_18020 [Halobacillus sp. HZG1]|uniref:hypothetical protein n=1 Tax=Halobacillus sp. HZG1 TaxID=3111769 RepID=UPI002DBE0AA1|nr:hypothetical protein [Halobacillus sp. HZG1]MEC3885622.1 hypothetical protein [Halobacillus sp. HZG1]